MSERSVATPATVVDLLFQRMRTSGAKTAIMTSAIVVVSFLALVPLIFLLRGTFISDAGGFTLEHLRSAYSSRFGFGTLTWNTLKFTIGSTAIAMPLGTTLAYINVRTNTPGKRLIFVASLVPLIIPGILHTIAWIFLASPRIGILNGAVEPVVGPEFFNIFSMGGMSLVEGLHTSPIVFLIMVAAFRSMDPSLEESALMSGASRLRVMARVTLPLAKPGLAAAALLMVINGLSSFEVPALLGIPDGIWVYTSRIWRVLSTFPTNYGEAGAYALALLTITAVGVFLQSRMSNRGRSYQTVTGKGFRPGNMDLGPWRWAAAAFVAVYFVFAVVLPLLVLLYMSTQNFYTTPSLDTLSHMTLDNYRYVFDHSQIRRALRNSLALGLGSATVVMLLTAIVSWIVVRTKVRGRSLLDQIAFLPLVVPGLVMGVALLFVYLRAPVPIYGTLWILFIAYLTKYMPYGMRYASTSLYQVANELEESAAVSGATWWQQFRRVTVPLILPGLVSGWLFILLLSVRELSSSILLYSPGNEVLSIVIWEQWHNGQSTKLAALGVLMIAGLLLITLLSTRIASQFGVREATR